MFGRCLIEDLFGRCEYDDVCLDEINMMTCVFMRFGEVVYG